MVFVFDWVTSLSIVTSRSIHAVAKGKISFFMKKPRLYSPLIYSWALALFPDLGYCE